MFSCDGGKDFFTKKKKKRKKKEAIEKPQLVRQTLTVLERPRGQPQKFGQAQESNWGPPVPSQAPKLQEMVCPFKDFHVR